MFLDLNVNYVADTKCLQSCIDTLQAFGYDGCAINVIVNGKLSSKNTNPIPRTCTSLSDYLEETKEFKKFSRLTIVLEDASQNYGLTITNPIISSYDILAIQPTNEKMFQLCCSTIEADIISLDMSSRLPFLLKHSTVGQAIERGIYFEISYSGSIRDPSCRKNLISNALSLIRVTRGKNVLISSEASKALDLRGPYDVINLATIFGLNQAQGKEGISRHARSVIYHADTRKNVYKSALKAIPITELSESDRWKVRKLDVHDEVLTLSH